MIFTESSDCVAHPLPTTTAVPGTLSRHISRLAQHLIHRDSFKHTYNHPNVPQQGLEKKNIWVDSLVETSPTGKEKKIE